MTIAPTKLARFDVRVRSFLAEHFKNRPLSLTELTGLWETYAQLGLPNEDFVAEFTNGKPASLAQRTWELLLAQHLYDQGHALTCIGNGPDLCFEHGGKRIWVEAVCPEPKGLPADWLDEPKPGQVKVGDFPHEQLLLRWTTAFDAKAKKLTDYLRKGTVLSTDAYIIAINGCQLGWTPGARGITQLPFGVETVFPVGPLQYKLNPDTTKIEGASISERFVIINQNGKPVATTPFVNPVYAAVSAVIGCASDRRHGKPLAMHIAHNPLATVAVPRGIYGVDEDEWFATPAPDAPGEFDLSHS
jgi:type I restriction enzyme S subunit